MKRNCVYLYSLIIIAVILCFTVNRASAITYGLPDPLSDFTRTWVAYYAPANSGTAVDDLDLGPDTSSSLSYSENGIDAFLIAMPYSLHGKISAPDLSVYDYPYFSTYSSFRDQIYFQTYNNQPAELVLNFNFDFTWLNGGLNSWMSFDLGVIARSTDNQAYPLYPSISLNDSYSGTLSVSTLQHPSYGGLVLNDSYFAFTFYLWADVNNGTLDWSNSIALDPENPYSVYQYDQQFNKTELLPGQYKLISSNEDFPSTVPEPATILLLGLGLVGLAGLPKNFN